MWVLLMLLLGCGERTDYEDVGRACMAGSGGEAALAADQAPRVTVTLAGCVSACGARDAECEATVDGDRIEVRASGWRAEHWGACSMECGSVTATCTIDAPLPEGTYVLAYAGEEVAAEVPGPVACVGWE